MTTSGSSAYNPTRDDMIRRSLRILGAIQSGETPGAQEISDASDALNAWVKEQETSGLHLWAETEGIAFMQPSQYNYGLGGGALDNITLVTGLASTTLSVAAATAATTISLTSLVGLSQNFFIGIMLSTNQLFWTTVSAPVTTNPITIAVALPSAVNAGALVYAYATPIQRPLQIINGRRFQLNSQIETPMIRRSRLDYREQPDKTNTGVITEYFYDPQLVTGQLWFWPNPVDSTNALKFTWMRTLQDFLVANNTADFPQEWVNAIVWCLAADLIPEYDVAPARQEFIIKRALLALDAVRGWDKEPEPVYFGVNFDQAVR